MTGLTGCITESAIFLNEEGMKYYSGDNKTVDFNKACNLFAMSAHLSFRHAQFNLGNCYRRGEGRTQDYEKAVYWYKKAVDQNFNPAKISYAATVLYKLKDDKSYNYAIQLLEEAKTDNDFRASFILGNAYHSGVGVEKNDQTAIDNYIYSANRGGAPAQALLFLIYEYGLYGQPNNSFDASKWQKIAEENPGLRIGEYNSLEYVIAGLYFNGWGVTKDMTIHDHYIEIADLLKSQQQAQINIQNR